MRDVTLLITWYKGYEGYCGDVGIAFCNLVNVLFSLMIKEILIVKDSYGYQSLGLVHFIKTPFNSYNAYNKWGFIKNDVECPASFMLSYSY